MVFDNKIKAEKTLKLQYEDFPEEIQGEEKKKYEKFLDELPRLRRGQASISAYDVVLNNKGDLSVTIVLRNGSDKAIKVEKLPITVKDARDIVIAKGIFELGEEQVAVGPNKAKLYNFVFTGKDILEDELHLSKWSVTFDN
jgi:SLAP domain-containing protein